MTSRDKFAHQRSRLKTPQRFNVLESRRPRALLIPFADIRKMYVAKNYSAYSERCQVVEHREEHGLESLWVRALLHQVHSQRVRLRANELTANSMEAHPAGVPLINIDEVCDVEARQQS